MPAFNEEGIPTLLASLTLEEKASLCSGADMWHTKAVESAKIPAIAVNDGPHGLRKQKQGVEELLGVGNSIPATCFPSAAGLASTWDRELIRRVGSALGKETRANSVSVLLGPGVNMKRSPLCGRNFEYFSEDPYLAGELATELVLGIQSQGVGTSLKHFAANNQETDRLRVDARIDERTLREIYLPAFEKVVTRAKPWTVMCSYNKINGTYASENPWLLTHVLREQWGFEGLVVSDWGAVNDRVEGIKAGLDLEMPASGGVNDARIVAAVEAGDLAESDLDRSVARVLRLVARSQEALADPGEFDAEAHHELAREAATEAAVLLKNDDGALPVGKEVLASDSVLIGEMARTPRYQGAGSSLVTPTKLESLRAALAERGLDVPFEPGYRLAEAETEAGETEAGESAPSDQELRARAVEVAAGKVAILVLGLPAVDESEGYDRTHMDIPASHQQLLREVSAVAAKTIVLLANGSAVTVSGWQEGADAVLELWLGGQAGGAAAADLLLGEAAPSGRLAESIPTTLESVPAQLNFPGEAGVVRYGERGFIGYRGLDALGAEVSYPFGHGLTYTSFGYSDLIVSARQVSEATEAEAGVVDISVTVTNTGAVAGVAVPQVYISRPGSSLARPPRVLAGFERFELEPGQSRNVEFTLTRREISHWDERAAAWAVEPGELVVEVGDSSRSLAARASVEIVAPPLRRPLTAMSTVGEWLEDPGAGPIILSKAGQLADLLGDEPTDVTMASFLREMPLAKAALMSMSGVLSPSDVEELVATFGA